MRVCRLVAAEDCDLRLTFSFLPFVTMQTLLDPKYAPVLQQLVALYTQEQAQFGRRDMVASGVGKAVMDYGAWHDQVCGLYERS